MQIYFNGKKRRETNTKRTEKKEEKDVLQQLFELQTGRRRLEKLWRIAQRIAQRITQRIAQWIAQWIVRRIVRRIVRWVVRIEIWSAFFKQRSIRGIFGRDIIVVVVVFPSVLIVDAERPLAIRHGIALRQLCAVTQVVVAVLDIVVSVVQPAHVLLLRTSVAGVVALVQPRWIRQLRIVECKSIRPSRYLVISLPLYLFIFLSRYLLI